MGWSIGFLVKRLWEHSMLRVPSNTLLDCQPTQRSGSFEKPATKVIERRGRFLIQPALFLTSRAALGRVLFDVGGVAFFG